MINPYLSFSGNCEEAFNFYRPVSAANFSDWYVSRKSLSNNPYRSLKGEKNMHVALLIGKAVRMTSGAPAAYGPPMTDSNFSISINTESEEEATWVFNGAFNRRPGNHAFRKAFWNACFGMFAGRFGM